MKKTLLALAICGAVLSANAKPWTWRFAYNYCTLSYSFAFYDESDWNAEIASLEQHGYNAAAIEAGLAKVWQLTLREIGASEQQIASFIPDTAARAWWCMGNLEGLGGPLTQAEIDRDARLGRHIAKTMLAHHIEPVFQGFVGTVPHDFADYGAAGAKVVGQGNWCGGFVRPAVLDPTSPRFAEVAKIWYRNLEAVYGVKPRLFGGDLFHEGGRTDGIDVTASARAVQREMMSAGGKDAVWFVQSWWGTPSDALLNGLTEHNTAILLLVKNMANGSDPSTLRSFGTKPWIWCEVSNFGGKSGLYGGIKMMCEFDRVVKSSKGKTLAGLGMLSEGVGLNPLWYEFFAEVMNRGDSVKKIEREELKRWIHQYATSRYGFADDKICEALMLLADSVYSPDALQEGPSENVLCAKPAWKITKATTWGTTRRYWNRDSVRRASQLFDEAIAAYQSQHAKRKSPITKRQAQNLRFDSVDFRRQVLQDDLAEALNSAPASTEAREKFLSLISDTDRLLAREPRFTYAYHQSQAERFGGEKAKAALHRMVTDWSGRSDVLDDYSQRQWSGLILDYYLPRWEQFFKTHNAVSP